MYLGVDDILEFPSDTNRNIEKCCNDESLLSCKEVKIHVENFLKDEIKFYGKTLQFSNESPPYGRDYKDSQGDEVSISYNKKSGSFFANFDSVDGKIYEVEKCHNSHVFKEIDVKNLKPAMPKLVLNARAQIQERNAPISDNSTIVTYSMMFYYTKEFAEVTADVEGFIDYSVELTNQAYINSKIPVRIKKFCSEEATLSEQNGDAFSLSKFRLMKGSSTATRNTADIATLFVRGPTFYCGIAWLVEANPDLSFSINVKGCIGGYTFAHEIGHNFGCHHDQYQASLKASEVNPYYKYGYGHHIQGGYRTILAYNRPGFSRRVNYHSNPDVKLPQTGTPTGITGESNNAAVFIRNRFAMADNGDESAVCGGRFSSGCN